MKRTSYGTGFIGLLGVLMLVGATARAASRIGYVNLSSVFESTEEGKQTLQRLKKEYAKKQQELNTRMKAFEEKAKRFQQRRAVMKEQARQEQMQKLGAEQQQLQALFMQYQQEIDGKKTEALRAFEQKVLDVVKTVARRDGLDYVLRQEMLLFAPVKMDITNEVIREYDKRHSAKTRGAKKKRK